MQQAQVKQFKMRNLGLAVSRTPNGKPIVRHPGSRNLLGLNRSHLRSETLSNGTVLYWQRNGTLGEDPVNGVNGGKRSRTRSKSRSKSKTRKHKGRKI